jgi:glycerophosphoryl diester phosphodiesterase
MLIIAHRGASGEALENTRSAFLAALHSGADMVETDLQLTMDGHLVIHHDATTRRLMNARRVIAREPLSRLRELRYANGDRLLTLAEFLELIDGNLPINLELKAPGSGRALLEYLAGNAYHGPIMVSSKDFEELSVFQHHGFDLPVGLVITAWSAALARKLALHPWQFVSINHRGLDSDTIHRLQNLGLKVFVFTVNAPDRIHELAAAGADGIFTDYPSLAVRELSASIGRSNLLQEKE